MINLALAYYRWGFLDVVRLFLGGCHPSLSRRFHGVLRFFEFSKQHFERGFRQFKCELLIEPTILCPILDWCHDFLEHQREIEAFFCRVNRGGNCIRQHVQLGNNYTVFNGLMLFD